MSETIFDKIIRGDIPSHKVYEDERVVAFLDVHPQRPGHTLVVPKVGVDHIWDMEDDEYAYLMAVVKKLGRHIKDVLGAPRVGVVVEGFGVPHVHVHLVPLESAEDLKRHQDMDGEPDHTRLAEVAEKLRFGN